LRVDEIDQFVCLRHHPVVHSIATPGRVVAVEISG
jgi:hypothetical protein